MDDRELPALDDVEELDDYWTENTTITVRRITKKQLDEYRDERPWDVFLEQLRREHADPITLNDAQAIADRVAEDIDGDVDAGEVALAVADYLMTEYDLAGKVADELEGRFKR